MQRLKDLVLLPPFPLLFYLLLLLQFLRHARLSKGLALAPLVCFGVEGRLQGGIPPHAGHHLLSQLAGEGQLENPPPNRSQVLGPDLNSMEQKGDSVHFCQSNCSGLSLKTRAAIVANFHGNFKDIRNILYS